MKKWLYAAGALLILFGAAILGRPERRLKKADERLHDLIMDGSHRAMEKATAASKKADKLQAEAKEVAKVQEDVVNKIGTQNESMRDLLDSWRKPDGV